MLFVGGGAGGAVPRHVCCSLLDIKESNIYMPHLLAFFTRAQGVDK